jgi:type IV secretion system protein VirD4
VKGTRQRNGQLGELERVVLVIAGITVLVGAFLYAWVALAGGLFGGGWPHLTAAQLSRAIARVPARLGDPRLAFPHRVRSQLPGPLGFYLALAALLVGVAIAVWLALRVSQQHRGPGGGKRTGAVGTQRGSRPAAPGAPGAR